MIQRQDEAFRVNCDLEDQIVHFGVSCNEDRITQGSPGLFPSQVDLVRCNHIKINRSLQLYLPGMELPVPLQDDDEKVTTWILLAHHAKNELRAELSLPLDVGSDGRVSVWQERIILRAQPLDGEQVVITPPVQPDIDVAVRRKA